MNYNFLNSFLKAFSCYLPRALKSIKFQFGSLYATLPPGGGQNGLQLNNN